MGNNNECRGRLEHLKKKPLDRPVTPDEMNRMPGRENHAKRTRLGKIFSLGRGLYQSVLYPEPVHYQDRDTGEWREIDNTLIPMTDGAGETYLINRSNDELRAEFHNTADAAMVLLEDEEGRMVSWQLEDARDIQPRPVERQCPRHEDCDRRRDVLDHLDGEVVFEGILPGVDIRCRVQSVSFKDDIIFFTRQSARPLSFLLSVPDMVPSLKENGDIQIIAPTGDVPFVLPAPFMKDSTTEGAFGGVLVTLAPTGEHDVWRMTYTPDEVWLDQAQFPVVLDPAVISKKHSSAIEDNFVTSYSPNTVQPYAGVGMKVSYNNSSWGTSKAFIKFLGSGLPEIDSSYYVTKAYFSVLTKTTPTMAASIYLKEALGDWSSQTITYNNAPALNSLALDYAYMEAYGTWYTYDISNLVRKWYAGTNYGFALEAGTSTYFELYTSDHATYKPFVTINYVSLAGLEDYLAYEDQPAGRAGVGHVSLYNGNLIFEHQDTVTTGSRMPLSVSHVYNSCYHDIDPFASGYGWKLNLHQCLHKETLEDSSGSVVYYVYTDGDGTRHHFKLVSGEWKDLSGLSLTLTITGNIATIKDKMDNQMVFPTPTAEFNGNYNNVAMLQEIRDACGNLATLEQLYGRTMIRATDGAGRLTAFRILEDGRTEAILAPGYTDETGLHYEYNDDGKLIRILHEDGNAATYTYNTLGLLESARNADGLTVTYEYYTERAPYRVKKTTLSNGETVGDSCLYEYGDMLTVVTDLTVPNGKKLFYHFNDFGNVVSVNDGLGYAYFAKYSPDQPVNHPQVVSKMQHVVSNYIKNHSFEGTADWYFYNPTSGNSAGYASDSHYLGSQSAKITIGPNLGFASASQLITLEKGKTYTFSFYARRTGSVDVRIQVNIGDYVVSSACYGPELGSEYTRLSYTFTVPADATTSDARIYLVAENAVGTAWFDCVQLEQGPLMNQYNVLVNGDFNFNLGAPQGWKANASNTSIDAVYATYDGVKPECLTANTFRIYGAGRTKYAGIYQDLSLSGRKGDVYTAGGWSMNHSMPRKGENFRYNIRVSFLPTTGGTRQNAPSIEWSEEWSDWQFAAGPVIAPCDYSYVRFNVDYERNINYTDFDGFFMFREEFGQTYQYDGEGNILATKDLASKQDSAVYDSYNNLTSYVRPGRASTVKTTLEYGTTVDEKKRHLLKKSVSPLGVIQEFSHDEAGNGMESKTSASATTAFMKSVASYDSSSNYPVSQTDARGKSSTTSYGAVSGTLDSVTDANGQQITYTYDVLKSLTETSATTGGKTYRNEYAYSDARRLTTVKHNTTSDMEADVCYGFAYDELGNPTTVKVGAQTLSTNVYTLTGDKLLERVEYGNGGKVRYTRDDFKRVTGMRYDEETADRYLYEFGANGQVGRLRDMNLLRTISYGYDNANRLMRVRTDCEDGTAYRTELGYDTYNNLSSFKEWADTRVYTTTYAYDNESRPTTVQYGSASDKVAYTYDALSRVSERTLTVGGTTYGTAYAFVEGGQGDHSTTPLTGSMTQAGHSFAYTYDNVGNIATEARNDQATAYGYDALGQLIRVDDPFQNKTFTYTYDRGGNLLAANAHAYTTGEAVGEATPTHTYTYGDSNWKDKLTAYDGKAITYDAIGNPLTYDGWTYAWQAGRQLAGMSGAGGSVAFSYNHDGLRVKKTGTAGTTDYVLHGKQIMEANVDGNRLHFFYDAQGRPAIVEFNGNKYGYVHNLQGDVVALIDSTGATVVEYRYDAWGAPVSKTGGLAGTLGTYNPFRYRGYVFDEETGLYYLRSRYYNPGWGRFVNADTNMGKIGLLMQHNQFAYCGNSPLLFSDHSGNSFLEAFFDELFFGTIRRVWNKVSIALSVAGLKHSATLLSHSNQYKSSNLHFDNNSSLAKDIKNDPDFQAEFNRQVTARNFNKTFSVTFNSNMDMFGSLHNVDARISIVKSGGKEKYYVRMHDTYDFKYEEEYTTPNGSTMKKAVYPLIMAGNNFAWNDMDAGVLNSYEIFISFYIDK